MESSSAEQQARIFIIPPEISFPFVLLSTAGKLAKQNYKLQKPTKTEMPTKMIPERGHNFASYCLLHTCCASPSHNPQKYILFNCPAARVCVKRITTHYSWADLIFYFMNHFSILSLALPLLNLFTWPDIFVFLLSFLNKNKYFFSFYNWKDGNLEIGNLHLI